MATVYLAEDLRHRRQVAIKVIHPEMAAAIGKDRFLREIEIAAQLNHPHILPLHDSGVAEGQLYYVMPYIAGESLRARMNHEGQLPVEDALRLTREIASALGHAHQHGIVHRDVKPENVLLSGGIALVADFGIARATGSSASHGSTQAATQAGMVLGTPRYMSPEQASGLVVDGRADLYALACVLYEMLAGHPPFVAPTAEGLIRQHLTVEAHAITALRPSVSSGVSAAIARGLAKLPADRFATAAEFTEALGDRASAAAAVPAVAVTPGPRRAWRLAVLAGTAGLLIGGALLMSRPSRPVLVPPSPRLPRSTVAVLPFQNLSGEGTHAYFAGGLHDELLTQLAKVAALRVISRTSVMGYRGTAKPLKQIANELGVGSVVEGSVQVVDGRLRVNVQLIDAGTDEHLWAERYDRTLDDGFEIQSEVAQQIVEAVGVTLTLAEQTGLTTVPTVNGEAYRLYLQGREYGTRPGVLRRDRETAQKLYEQALRLDEGFALAHAALSEVHGEMYWFRYDPSAGRAARQREEAEVALRLAPALPQAHMAMGLSHYWGRRDYKRALQEFTIALKGLPNDADLWQRIGLVHRRMGNWKEAFATFDRSKQLEPRNAGLFLELGYTYQYVRRYPDALRAYDQALSLAPDFYEAAIARGMTYLVWQGQLDTLRAVLGHVPSGADLDDVAARRVALLLWERKAGPLLEVLENEQVDVYRGQGYFLPGALYAGWAHRLRRDRQAAQAAFDLARIRLDAALIELPDDWRVHAARGLALAGLGRRDEALREANWLQQSVVYREDMLDGSELALDRARILAQAGEDKSALDEIQRLLAQPSDVSVHTLEIDLRFDPIRDHPRFKLLMEKYGR